MNSKLTDKQLRFCKEYVIDLNATQAAIRSGYSKNTARNIGANLLTLVNVQEEISKLKNKTANKLEITHEMLTDEWQKMAFSSISYLHNTWIELKDFEQLKQENPDILSCIQETFTKTETKREYNPLNQKKDIEIETKYIKLKLYDKQKALENLGKHIGYYEKDNEQKNVLITGISFNE
ncbi:MAG: terminase small subunit [Flavobacteriaceae bacterium]|nr:terminase small subunit [Flavobacteriaceae bacterium]